MATLRLAYSFFKLEFIIRFIYGQCFSQFQLIREYIDSESTWHNGLTYNLKHCFIIKAGNSSNPGAEFFITEIILSILSSVTSMVLMMWTLFAIYFNGPMSDFISSERF